MILFHLHLKFLLQMNESLGDNNQNNNNNEISTSNNVRDQHEGSCSQNNHPSLQNNQASTSISNNPYPQTSTQNPSIVSHNPIPNNVNPFQRSYSNTISSLNNPPLPIIPNSVTVNQPRSNTSQFHYQNSISSNPPYFNSFQNPPNNYCPANSYPSMQPYQSSFYQPPPNNPNIRPNPYTQNPNGAVGMPPNITPVGMLNQMNPTAPFAAINEPMKRFDGLDPTYTPDKFLHTLNARITFSLGIQPTDPIQYGHWHHRR